MRSAISMGRTSTSIPTLARGSIPTGNTFIFNFGRPEVANFLVANALFWVDKYHIDGLRVDAVASMLYRDYSRKPGEWIPNQFGGRENLEAIDLLKRVNDRVHAEFPGVLTIAEESTAWPKVTRPVGEGGLGFDLKWDMGWMHDTLSYFEKDPIYRKHHHNQLTFRGLYAYCRELRPAALARRGGLRQGGRWSTRCPAIPGRQFRQRPASLRLPCSPSPARRCLFMGDEFGQAKELEPRYVQLDWGLARPSPCTPGPEALGPRPQYPLPRDCPELHELDAQPRRDSSGSMPTTRNKASSV